MLRFFQAPCNVALASFELLFGDGARLECFVERAELGTKRVPVIQGLLGLLDHLLEDRDQTPERPRQEAHATPVRSASAASSSSLTQLNGAHGPLHRN